MFPELWMHRLVCRAELNMFLPDNLCGKVELAESQYEWSTPQERPGCDLLVKRTFAISSSWQLEEGNTTDLED